MLCPYIHRADSHDSMLLHLPLYSKVRNEKTKDFHFGSLAIDEGV
jgi:hypothetical protein